MTDSGRKNCTDLSASSDSCSSSAHKSASSPDRHARRKNANAKLSAARDPTRANPIVAFSAGFSALPNNHLL